jgi:hypothetical protein
MSAAARPKPWGVSRQAKGREFDPAGSKSRLYPCRILHPTYLTGCAIMGTWGSSGEAIQKHNDIHKLDIMDWMISISFTDRSELAPTTDVEIILPYFTRYERVNVQFALELDVIAKPEWLYRLSLSELLPFFFLCFLYIHIVFYTMFHILPLFCIPQLFYRLDQC